MLLLPGAKLPDQGYHLLYQLLQFLGFGSQLVEESQRFLLPVTGVNSLYALVVVIPDGPELGIKLGQPHVKIKRVFVLRDDCKVSTEYPRPDKIGGVPGLCSAEHSQEFLVFLVVQFDIVTVRFRIGKDFPACRIADLLVVFHKAIGLMVRLGRTCPHPERCSGAAFGRLKIFWAAESTPRYMLARIKIRPGPD